MADNAKRRFARIDRLPPYVFNITAELKMAARRRGEDIIDFSMGNPDGATPPHIVEKLVQVAQREDTHGYSTSRGIPRLRRAISRWYKDRYDVEIDPESEAIVTIGSKEGLAHLMLATLDHGDTVLVPNPSYPIHIYGAVIAGAQVRSVPLVPGVDFFAELERAIREAIPKPKMMILGFPSNPTAQCVELDFFERVVALAKQYDVLVIHDLAYADIVYDGWKAPSIMQVPGAKDIAVEFFTLSKSYNMPGWRVGFMCGNPTLIAALARMKSYLDYGMFTPIQVAAIAALEGLERAREQGGVHADAGVFDLQSVVPEANPDAAGVGEPRRIAQQVAQHHPEHARRRMQHGIGGVLHLQVHRLALELVAQPRDRVLDDVAGRKVLGLQRHLLVARQQQQGFHERFHRRIRGLDARQRAPRTFRQPVIVRHQVRGHADHGERRAQLVAGIAGEIALARHAGIHARPQPVQGIGQLARVALQPRRDALRGEHMGVGSRRIPARDFAQQPVHGGEHALGGTVAQPGRGGDRTQRDQDRRQHRPRERQLPVSRGQAQHAQQHHQAGDRHLEQEYHADVAPRERHEVSRAGQPGWPDRSAMR